MEHIHELFRAERPQHQVALSCCVLKMQLHCFMLWDSFFQRSLSCRTIVRDFAEARAVVVIIMAPAARILANKPPGEKYPLVTAEPPADRTHPMFVLPIERVLALTRFQPHEELQAELIEWTEGMAPAVFCSHTWLSFSHPDSEANDKLRLLQFLLRDIIAGGRNIECHYIAKIIYSVKGGMKLDVPAHELQRDLSSGYLWFE